jgi:hypothetical protein
VRSFNYCKQSFSCKIFRVISAYVAPLVVQRGEVISGSVAGIFRSGKRHLPAVSPGFCHLISLGP